MITAGKISVLIIDDDAVTRFLHKKIVESLTQFKATSFEAVNGLDALTHIIAAYSKYRTVPDIILLDCAMPTMDGLDFLTQLRSIYFAKNIKVIIVSVSDSSIDKENAKSLGVEYFFTKPLTTSLLKSSIIECIGDVREGRDEDVVHRPSYLYDGVTPPLGADF
jgi:CheY-like chemotaxis protein